jgi:hypothetical protein
MNSQDTLSLVFCELADWYDQRGDRCLRDRFLVLAMDAACRAGENAEAEKLRQWLFQVNPHHMLRPFASFAEAAQTPDVRTYLHELRTTYPNDVAQVLLRSLRANATDALSNTSPIKSYKLPPAKEAAAPRANGQPPVVSPRPAPVPLPSESNRAPAARTAKRERTKGEPRSPTHAPYGAAQGQGGWLGVVLFVVVLLVGVAATGFVAARPFVTGVIGAVKK